MFTREPDHRTDAPPRRRRRWLLLLGGALVLAVLVAVGWIMSANSRLEQAIADADAEDPAWRLKDLEKARPTPPPGQNAADRVLTIAKLKPGNWYDPKHDELLSNLHPAALLNDSQVAAVRAILQSAGPAALAQARTLIETPRGRFAVQWSPDFVSTVVECQENRGVAHLLRCDALERAQAGDLAGAVAACHAGFHAGCSIGDEPFSISQLVRIAVQAVATNTLERVLAQGEPSADRLAALQARLEAEEPAPLFLYMVRGERAGSNHLYEDLRKGPLLSQPITLTMQQPNHLRYLNEMVAVAKKPPEEWNALLAPHRTGLRGQPMVIQMLAPAIDKMGQASQRNHAVLRSAIVALAAERFRQQHGRWPETLDELVRSKLLSAVPTDSYNGAPIKLARTADGLVVYCVGPDGADNGGKIDRQNPTKPGTDLGFQLWDAPARRAPALPPKPSGPDDGRGPRP